MSDWIKDTRQFICDIANNRNFHESDFDNEAVTNLKVHLLLPSKNNAKAKAGDGETAVPEEWLDK